MQALTLEIDLYHPLDHSVLALDIANSIYRHEQTDPENRHCNQMQTNSQNSIHHRYKNDGSYEEGHFQTDTQESAHHRQALALQEYPFPSYARFYRNLQKFECHYVYFCLLIYRTNLRPNDLCE